MPKVAEAWTKAVTRDGETRKSLMRNRMFPVRCEGLRTQGWHWLRKWVGFCFKGRTEKEVMLRGGAGAELLTYWAPADEPHNWPQRWRTHRPTQWLPGFLPSCWRSISREDTCISAQTHTPPFNRLFNSSQEILGTEDSTCLQCGNKSPPELHQQVQITQVRCRAGPPAPWEQLSSSSSWATQVGRNTASPSPQGCSCFSFPWSLLCPRVSDTRNLVRGPHSSFSPGPAPALPQPQPGPSCNSCAYPTTSCLDPLLLTWPVFQTVPCYIARRLSQMQNLIMLLKILSQIYILLEDKPQISTRGPERSLMFGFYPCLQGHFITLPLTHCCGCFAVSPFLALCSALIRPCPMQI